MCVFVEKLDKMLLLYVCQTKGGGGDCDKVPRPHYDNAINYIEQILDAIQNKVNVRLNLKIEKGEEGNGIKIINRG